MLDVVTNMVSGVPGRYEQPTHVYYCHGTMASRVNQAYLRSARMLRNSFRVAQNYLRRAQYVRTSSIATSMDRSFKVLITIISPPIPRTSFIPRLRECKSAPYPSPYKIFSANSNAYPSPALKNQQSWPQGYRKYSAHRCFSVNVKCFPLTHFPPSPLHPSPTHVHNMAMQHYNPTRIILRSIPRRAPHIQ